MIAYFDNDVTMEDKEGMMAAFGADNKYELAVGDSKYEVTSAMMTLTKKTITVTEEKYLPGVIEPSFGIGRAVWFILEHCFRYRVKDAKRCYFLFPPKIAPVKCSILPIIAKPEFLKHVRIVEKVLKRKGISTKVDATDNTIGRRYARTDELGIPFGIAIDE